MNYQVVVAVAVLCSLCHVQEARSQQPEKQGEPQLIAPANWKGERISLPPSFARDMKLKGAEVIRFAPGMFNAESNSFFSYVLVFQVAPEPKLTKEVLHGEILTYYRGLSAAVMKSGDQPVDASGLRLELKIIENAKDAQRPPNLSSFSGKLNWIEPFVTRKPQTLNLLLEAWQDSKTRHNYLFVIASPKERTKPIWKTMEEIRAGFHKARE